MATPFLELVSNYSIKVGFCRVWFVGIVRHVQPWAWHYELLTKIPKYEKEGKIIVCSIDENKLTTLCNLTI
ncbi:hypothetical protein [Pseudanabaena sp. UWO310]|uniref:hypothetical protein n=1 Tax=Pseudanabaena sp. UWO310 TaxID=2480795 RepID=UPI00115715D1|nr:hypothetical protein [Pseudanabaena sp. UWO310]TYQ30926.1 hypothetical protein PseudUWO310_06165 [Pseudanabaena sp. UWO310]